MALKWTTSTGGLVFFHGLDVYRNRFPNPVRLEFEDGGKDCRDGAYPRKGWLHNTVDIPVRIVSYSPSLVFDLDYHFLWPVNGEGPSKLRVSLTAPHWELHLQREFGACDTHGLWLRQVLDLRDRNLVPMDYHEFCTHWGYHTDLDLNEPAPNELAGSAENIIQQMFQPPREPKPRPKLRRLPHLPGEEGPRIIQGD